MRGATLYLEQDEECTVKIFWLSDSLCLKVENDVERNALQVVHTALLQTTEVETEQAPGICPGLNLVDNTSVSVAYEAQLIGISLTRMQSLLSGYDLTRSRTCLAVDDVLRTH
jgi:hypothetical protein